MKLNLKYSHLLKNFPNSMKLNGKNTFKLLHKWMKNLKKYLRNWSRSQIGKSENKLWKSMLESLKSQLNFKWKKWSIYLLPIIQFLNNYSPNMLSYCFPILIKMLTWKSFLGTFPQTFSLTERANKSLECLIL